MNGKAAEMRSTHLCLYIDVDIRDPLWHSLGRSSFSHPGILQRTGGQVNQSHTHAKGGYLKRRLRNARMTDGQRTPYLGGTLARKELIAGLRWTAGSGCAGKMLHGLETPRGLDIRIHICIRKL